MQTDAPTFVLPTTLDLSGLPAHAVQQILKIAQDARPNAAPAASSPNPENPEQWLDDLLAFVNRQPKRNVVLDMDRESIYSEREQW